jgi:hypothetical protein
MPGAVSGSDASCTLVSADGVPLNDPFGSWVYWNRIPFAAVHKVDVVRGATGDLDGAGALGGVVLAPHVPRRFECLRDPASRDSRSTHLITRVAITERSCGPDVQAATTPPGTRARRHAGH